MNNNWSSLLITAIALTAIVGCGGSSSNGPASGATVQHYYVADSGNNRIVRFDSFASRSGFVFFENSVLSNPTDIAFDSSGRIYVVDQGHNQITRVDSDLASNYTTYTGTSGVITAGYNAPTGIAIDGQNRIYVTDTANKRIIRTDDTTGTNWVSFPSPTSTNQPNPVSPFTKPWGIRVDGSDHIYVSDQATNTVYEMDDMSGTNLRSIKTFASPTPTFNGPTGLEIDFQGKLYVADTGNNRIVRFDDITGANEAEWDSGGTVSNMVGFTVLGRDQILMADQGNPSAAASQQSLHSRIYRVLDITGSSPSTYGTYGTGTDQLKNPQMVRGY